MQELEHYINTGSDRFENYFPQFIIALRDFSLLLEIDGKEVTADEYLEYSLVSRKGDEEINYTRECIKKYFKHRRCFTFDRPASRRKLMMLDQVKDSELSEDFVEEMERFTQFIYLHGQVKSLLIGEKGLLQLKGKGK